MDTPMRRMIGASVLVTAMFAGLALLSGVKVTVPEEGAYASFSGRAWAQRLIANEAGAKGEFRESGARGGDAVDGARRRPDEAPGWVQEEIVDLDGVHELRAIDDWSVLGFTVDGTEQQARSWVELQLKERGWALVDSGAAGSATAVKEEGNCSWLLFSCTEAGDATCVVVQVRAR